MGVVFGLYSTREPVVRAVAQTEYDSAKTLDLLTTRALDREPGAILEWMREEWRGGYEVKAFDLQEEIIPADLEMFENYWREQFADLVGPVAATTTSKTGEQINLAIQRRLRGDTA